MEGPRKLWDLAHRAEQSQCLSSWWGWRQRRYTKRLHSYPPTYPVTLIFTLLSLYLPWYRPYKTVVATLIASYPPAQPFPLLNLSHPLNLLSCHPLNLVMVISYPLNLLLLTYHTFAMCIGPVGGDLNGRPSVCLYEGKLALASPRGAWKGNTGMESKTGTNRQENVECKTCTCWSISKLLYSCTIRSLYDYEDCWSITKDLWVHVIIVASLLIWFYMVWWVCLYCSIHDIIDRLIAIISLLFLFFILLLLMFWNIKILSILLLMTSLLYKVDNAQRYRATWWGWWDF